MFEPGLRQVMVGEAIARAISGRADRQADALRARRVGSRRRLQLRRLRRQQRNLDRPRPASRRLRTAGRQQFAAGASHRSEAARSLDVMRKMPKTEEQPEPKIPAGTFMASVTDDQRIGSQRDRREGILRSDDVGRRCCCRRWASPWRSSWRSAARSRRPTRCTPPSPAARAKSARCGRSASAGARSCVVHARIDLPGAARRHPRRADRAADQRPDHRRRQLRDLQRDRVQVPRHARHDRLAA